MWSSSSTDQNDCRNILPQDDTSADSKQFINFRDEDQMEIRGYKKDSFKITIIWIFYFLTLGLLRLIFHWCPCWKLYSTHTKCDLLYADKVLVVDSYQEKFKQYLVEDVEYLSAANVRALKNSKTSNGINKKPKEQNGTTEKNSVQVPQQADEDIRAIWCKKLCYLWNQEQGKFVKLQGLDKGVKREEYYNFTGFTASHQASRHDTYGSNDISVPTKSIVSLIILEALTPFYVFQVFSLVVWLAEFYFYYTVAIIVMSTFGIASSIIQTRKNEKSLREAIHSSEIVTVCRGNDVLEEISSTDLVPGDVIVISTHGCVMQCDAVVLSGSCIVNESMLTGESVPVTKTPIPKNSGFFNAKEDSHHTLFCGTKIIQTRNYGNKGILAVVLRTGYLTTKGQLVRSILYPPPSDFKFDRDSYKFIGILAFIAALGFIYTLVSKSSHDVDLTEMILKALDVITVVIPPALPAAMTVGKLYALSRLKGNKIYCMNSRVINVSGSINCVCFDKTGTLTEDGLDIWGVVPVENNKLHIPVKDVKCLPKGSLLHKGMISCHSLAVIDGELLGDPLDLKMFESTGWSLEEQQPGESNNALVAIAPKYTYRRVSCISIHSSQDPQGEENSLEIIHQNQFSSHLQRMSVITKSNGCDYFEGFCKGAPEMLISLSKPETVPNDVLDKLKEYTRRGYRVIAVARKVLNLSLEEVQKLSRDDLECDLTFVGLVVLENQVKRETTSIINTIKQANIKTVMITGDNIETALSVARECGIVETNQTVLNVSVIEPSTNTNATISFTVNGWSYEDTLNYKIKAENFLQNSADVELGSSGSKYCYAMTGFTWARLRKHFPEEIPKLVARGVVFARMLSEQKQQLIQELQALGYYVAMCGDGANDCGALKTAHVGISLSEAEASVASPFTSKEQNISCVPKVIKEGRAALATSFGVFKFMVCYSLTQFTSMIILYSIDTNLTSFEFLFIDMCLIVNFTSFFGKTKAYNGIAKVLPPTTLLGVVPLCSIISQMLLIIVFQASSYHIIQTYDWFTPFVYNSTISTDAALGYTTRYVCYENFAVFAISLFQYIILAIVLSKGKPYRLPIYTNYILVASMSLMTVICSYIILHPASWIITLLGLKVPDTYDARVMFLVLALANFGCSLFAEDFIVEYLLKKCLLVCKVKNIPNKCLAVENGVKFDKTWLNIKMSVESENGLKGGKKNGHSLEERNGSVVFAHGEPEGAVDITRL